MMTAASTMGSADAVAFSCPGAPSGVSCTFAPAQVSVPGNGNAMTTLTVTVTSKPSSGSLYKFPKGTLPSQRLMLWWFIAALSLILAGMIASSRRGRAGSPILAPGAAIIILTLVLSAGLVSCGLTGAPKTPTITNPSTQPVSFTPDRPGAGSNWVGQGQHPTSNHGAIEDSRGISDCAHPSLTVVKSGPTITRL